MFSALASLALLQSDWKPPFSIVSTPILTKREADSLTLGQGKGWIKGDTLTFAVKAQKEKPVLINMIGLSLTKLPESDIWAAQAKMDSWDKAVLSYSFILDSPDPLQVLRGAKAPKIPQRSTFLAGTLKDFLLESKSLKEKRWVSVYIPPNPGPNLPALYIADGQSTANTAGIVDRMVREGKIRPIAVIGVHNGGYRGKPNEYDFNKDFRAKEYLKVFDPERYEQHLTFFADEVRIWAESAFKLSPQRSNRAIHGFSNGGAFAATASADRPEIYGAALPYSVGAIRLDGLKDSVKGRKLPRYLFAAGSLEVFINNTQKTKDALESLGAEARMDTFMAGHDSMMWDIALARHLTKVFPPAPL